MQSKCKSNERTSIFAYKHLSALLIKKQNIPLSETFLLLPGINLFYYVLQLSPLPYFFFKNKEDPQHCTTPLAIIAIRSPRRSASSMKCVVRSMVLPVRSCWRRSQMIRRAPGSIPEVGSSKNTTRLPAQRAMPTESLRFIPPDRVFAWWKPDYVNVML